MINKKALINWFDNIYPKNEGFEKLPQDACVRMSTNDVSVICAYINLDITTSRYGKIMIITQTPNETYRRFTFNIRNPECGSVSTSNKILYVDQIHQDETDETFFTYPDDLRPVSAPSEYRNIITRFENKVIKYSREMDYCRKCRNIERRKKNQKGE